VSFGPHSHVVTRRRVRSALQPRRQPPVWPFEVVWTPPPPRSVLFGPHSHVITPQSGRSRWCGPHRHLIRCCLDPTATSSPPNLAVRGGVHPTASSFGVVWTPQPRRHPPIWPFEVVWTPPPPRSVLFGCKPHCHLVCCHLDPIATSSLAATFVQPYSHVTVNLAVWDGVDPTATLYIAVWTPQPCCHKYNVIYVILKHSRDYQLVYYYYCYYYIFIRVFRSNVKHTTRWL